jgi:hypothetical protein
VNEEDSERDRATQEEERTLLTAHGGGEGLFTINTLTDEDQESGCSVRFAPRPPPFAPPPQTRRDLSCCFSFDVCCGDFGVTVCVCAHIQMCVVLVYMCVCCMSVCAAFKCWEAASNASPQILY